LPPHQLLTLTQREKKDTDFGVTPDWINLEFYLNLFYNIGMVRLAKRQKI
jgi:hypothetical protein